MPESYEKAGKKYPPQWRFFYGYLQKAKDGKTFIKGKVEEDTMLKKGEVVLIFPAKVRRKESSPQYYGFHQAPEDPNPVAAPQEKPESEDPADEF
jgi:hypothetical protein